MTRVKLIVVALPPILTSLRTIFSNFLLNSPFPPILDGRMEQLMSPWSLQVTWRTILLQKYPSMKIILFDIVGQKSKGRVKFTGNIPKLWNLVSNPFRGWIIEALISLNIIMTITIIISPWLTVWSLSWKAIFIEFCFSQFVSNFHYVLTLA